MPPRPPAAAQGHHEATGDHEAEGDLIEVDEASSNGDPDVDEDQEAKAIESDDTATRKRKGKADTPKQAKHSKQARHPKFAANVALEETSCIAPCLFVHVQVFCRLYMYM